MKRIRINKITKSNKDSHYTRERLHRVYLGNELNCYSAYIKKREYFQF